MGVFKRLFKLVHPPWGRTDQARVADHNASEIVLDSVYAAAFQTEVDIDAGIASHQALRGRLQVLLDGTPGPGLDPALEPEVLCLDHVCRLGRWLHGTGREALGPSHAFDLLVARHQYFHAQAAAVVAYHQSGDPIKARHTLDGTYHRSSTQVVLLLDEFKRQLGH